MGCFQLRKPQFLFIEFLSLRLLEKKIYAAFFLSEITDKRQLPTNLNNQKSMFFVCSFAPVLGDKKKYGCFKYTTDNYLNLEFNKKLLYYRENVVATVYCCRSERALSERARQHTNFVQLLKISILPEPQTMLVKSHFTNMQRAAI